MPTYNDTIWSQDAHDERHSGHTPRLNPGANRTLKFRFNSSDASGGTTARVFTRKGLTARDGRFVFSATNMFVVAADLGVYAVPLSSTGIVTGTSTGVLNQAGIGTIVASPGFDQVTGTLIVGSLNGNLYKLRESDLAILATYAGGSPIRTGITISGDSAWYGDDAGKMHRVLIASMTAATNFPFTLAAGQAVQTAPAVSPSRSIATCDTADLYTNCVTFSGAWASWGGTPAGRRKHTTHSPTDVDGSGRVYARRTHALSVIAEQTGLVFTTLQLAIEAMTSFYNGDNGTGLANNSQVQTWLKTTHPEQKSMFAIDLLTGNESFVPNVGWGSTEDVLDPTGYTLQNTITAISYSGTTVTVTTQNPHSLSAGSIWNNIVGVTGFGDNSIINGPHGYSVLSVPAPTSNQFSFTASAAPTGAYTANSGTLYMNHSAYPIIGQSPVVAVFNGVESVITGARDYSPDLSAGDYRETGFLAQMALVAGQVFTGSQPGYTRYINFPKNKGYSHPIASGGSYQFIIDERSMLTAAGGQKSTDNPVIADTHWDAQESTTASGASLANAAAGASYSSPVSSTMRPPHMHGLKNPVVYNDTTLQCSDSTLNSAEEDPTSRAWPGAGTYGFRGPRPPDSSSGAQAIGALWNTTAYSIGFTPRYTVWTLGPGNTVLEAIAGNDQDITVWDTSGTISPPATQIGTATPVSSTVSVYGAYRASFSVTGSPATNPQIPYDASAPAGITNNGISVDAQFLPPGQTNWANAITHPCFYNDPKTLTTPGGNLNVLPTSGANSGWLARFTSLNTWTPGTANWRVRVVDGNGTNYQAQPSFQVTAAAAGAHGFIKVSAAEPREFEYSDGTWAPTYGVNDQIGTALPAKYTGIGLPAIRTWLSNILPLGFASGDVYLSPWFALNAPGYLAPAPATPPSTFGFHLTGGSSTSALKTFGTNLIQQAFTSCRRATQYRFSFTVRTSGLSATGKVTLKIAGDSDATTVTSVLASPTATLISTTPGSAPTTWTTYTGLYTTGATDDFFGGTTGKVYPALEGSTTGFADVCQLLCQEVLAGGTYGPNQWDYAYGALDTFSQVGSAIMDAQIADAESKGISLKLVLEDKSEIAWKYLNATGTIAASTTGDMGTVTAASMSGSTVTLTVSGVTTGIQPGATWISSGDAAFGYKGQWLVSGKTANTVSFTTTSPGQPPASPVGTWQVDNYWNDLTNSQTGWLHKAWMRYVLARWGYSTAIHSWEHLNEGDAGAEQQTFTNQWAGWVHTNDVNLHPVSTSTAIGVNTAFWAGIPNADYPDTHAYNDTGELGRYDWVRPLIDNAGTRSWTQPAAGVMRMDCSVTPHDYYSAFVCQEAGTWSYSVDVDPSAVTGGTFGVTGEGMSLLLAAGAARQVLSGTFPVTLTNGTYTANFLLGAGTHTGGSGDLRNATLTSPSGKRLYTLLGDGTLPLQTDITQDTAAFHTAYDRFLTGNRGYSSAAGQGLYGKPAVRGEWSPGTASSPANTYAAWVASDTNIVWLHCALFAQLAPGGLHEFWWNLASNPIDANNGWGKFTPYGNFIANLPLNNGKYSDIRATASGQTNGSVVAVGQKDVTNNRAHIWIRPKSFTGYGATLTPKPWLPGGVAGQIMTGTLSFSGFVDGTYAASLWEFDAAGLLVQSSQNVSCVSSIIALNLTALRPTTTDVAISLAPYVAPGGGGGGGGGGVVQTVAGPINFDFEIRDSTGALVTGLIPTVQGGKVLDDAGNLVSFPNPTEVSQTYAPGWYRSPFDLIASGAVGDVVGTILTTLAAPRDKIPFKITRETFRLVNNLDAQVSRVPVGTGAATPGQGDTSGAPATPVWGKH